ncbi:MAG: gluconokinase [Phycicoccus sp.]|uniref:gluconokinase n=1 Tax=Phycicoccus sp. TaxID=1902410 RepID=UPI002585331B|nr:gluconokinase [Phycicoccus sp.]MCO5303250.1 gluconokinase [Phycicoccus sp.]
MSDVVVVMGVSSVGKTTVAKGLSALMGWEFAEGDAFHPQANIDKMSSGVPLTDEDRWPWLQSLAEWTAQRAAAGEGTGVACSALRRAYRDVLRKGATDTVFVHFAGTAEVIIERMKAREHFMPTSLLESQFATLEPLEPDEHGIVVDIAAPLDDIVADLVDRLGSV